MLMGGFILFGDREERMENLLENTEVQSAYEERNEQYVGF